MNKIILIISTIFLIISCSSNEEIITKEDVEFETLNQEQKNIILDEENKVLSGESESPHSTGSTGNTENINLLIEDELIKKDNNGKLIVNESRENKRSKSFILNEEITEINNYVNDGNYNEAENKLLILLENDRNNSLILSNLGKVYLKQGNFEKSKKYFLMSNLIENGENINTLFNIGLIYNILGDPETAKTYMLKCLDIDKDYQLALNFLKN